MSRTLPSGVKAIGAAELLGASRTHPPLATGIAPILAPIAASVSPFS